MTELPQNGWRVGVVPVRFALGEWSFAVARLKCLVRTGSFVSSPALDARLPPCPELPPDVRGAALTSWPVGEDLGSLRLEGGVIRYVESRFPRYFVEIKGTFEQYLGHFGGKVRKNLLRSVRACGRPNGARLDVREYRDEREACEFHRVATGISRLTYQHRLVGAGLPDTPEFLSALSSVAKAGRVRGYVLFFADQPVAFAYCTLTGSTIHYDVIGYDPTCAQLSPGTVLLFEIMRHVFDEGLFDLFDFGPGEAHYKSSFSTCVRRCANILYLKPTAGNTAFVVAHLFMRSLSATAGALLTRIGLKQKVRMLLRRSAHVSGGK